MKKEISFTETLNQLARLSFLLKSGLNYDVSYYLVYGEWHCDCDKKVIGVIDGDVWCGIAPKLNCEPSKNS